MTQTEVSINICTLCMLLPECTPCCSALWVKTPAHECTYLSASESGKHVPNQKHFKDLKFEDESSLSWAKMCSKRNMCVILAANINLLMDFKIVANKHKFFKDTKVKKTIFDSSPKSHCYFTPWFELNREINVFIYFWQKKLDYFRHVLFHWFLCFDHIFV